MVADHSAEPTTLLTHMCHIVTNISGRGDTNFHGLRISTRIASSFTNSLNCPRSNVDIGELQDKAVTNFARQLQRFWPVCGDPNFTLAFRRPLKFNF